MNLFKKVACLTDIHFGLRNGSRTHNQDCEDFVVWFCEQARQENCETCIMLGDWHHNRSVTDISTMNYTVSNLERLDKNFDQVFLIMGNHDEYYKDKREIHSLEYARLFKNVHVINDIFTAGDVSILPWLVGEEWKTIQKLKSRYIFGHLELPGFYMNAMVQMPDHGQIQNSHFSNQEKVFTGHFHKRQHHQNISYIGNAFPHNYADAGDDDRGMMILEWGKEPEYRAWPGQPTYRLFRLSEIINNADTLLKEKMNCRVAIDVPLTFEEANYVKETLIPQFKLRELTLIPEKTEIDTSVSVDVSFESVDSIVMNQINAIDSETFDKKLLLEIYTNL